MPDWLIPVVIALGGGTGIGALVNAFMSGRTAAFNELHTVVKMMQKERDADRQEVAHLKGEVSGLYLQLSLHREYNAALQAWALAGSPPPPPERPVGLH